MGEGGDVWSGQSGELELEAACVDRPSCGCWLKAEGWGSSDRPCVLPEKRAPCQNANLFSHV